MIPFFLTQPIGKAVSSGRTHHEDGREIIQTASIITHRPSFIIACPLILLHFIHTTLLTCIVHIIRGKMPTPESAEFLARKPTVPPTYDGVDYEDTVALHNARDAIIREQWIRSMMSRLVGVELSKCYIREGVNHFEKCGFLRGWFFFFFFFFFFFWCFGYDA